MGVLNNEELEAVHTIERYGTALNASDAVTIAEELFAADGQFYPAGQTTVVGTKALLESYEGLAKIPGGFKLTFTFRTVSVSGSGRQMMASVHSTSAGTVGGAAAAFRELWSLVKDGADGEWRIAAYMMDSPPESLHSSTTELTSLKCVCGIWCFPGQVAGLPAELPTMYYVVNSIILM